MILNNLLVAVNDKVQDPENIEKTLEEVEEFTQNKGWLYIDWESVGRTLLEVAITAIIGIVLIKIIRILVNRFFRRKGMRKTLSYFVDSFLKFGLGFLLIIILSRELGFQTTSLIALLGSIGIAIGLALQGSLSDLASGLLILILRPIRYNDYIYLGERTELLRVTDIRLFNTGFKTSRGFTVIIPNRTIVQERITNLSKTELVKIEVLFDVSYNANLKEVRKVVTEVLKNETNLNKEAGYQVLVSTLGDSGVTMLARGSVTPENYLTATFSLRENIKTALDEAGIEIPFPQVEVRMYEEDKKDFL